VTVLWIILACFVVAVIVGTAVVAAKKQRATEAPSVEWDVRASGEATGVAPTEPPAPEPPGTVP
jgi:hypothetical protein